MLQTALLFYKKYTKLTAVQFDSEERLKIMDKNVSAKRFFEDFKAISKDEEAIKQYHDNKGFTNYVINKINSNY